MFFENDDTDLKIVFYTIIVLYTMTVVGVWESFIKPLWLVVIKLLMPFLIYAWQLAGGK